jgi:hypothetical protein
MVESDLVGLPDVTKALAYRLFSLGLDRPRVHGFFVILGLYAGAPETQEKIDQLFSQINKFLPLDRSKNIDEIVGHVYDGYDRQINEFCFRSGVQLEFRKIAIPGVTKTISVVNPQDEGLLDSNVFGIDRLSGSSRLYGSFIDALGQPTFRREASLLESFTCGVFQMQLHAQSDVNGTRQLALLIREGLPLFLGRCFRSVVTGNVDYFLGLIDEQIPLIELMQGMEISYAREMWGFQSSLFYRDQQLISGVSELSPFEWHDWVLNRGRAFDAAYSEKLTPFSKSGITLSDIPDWESEIANFDSCDRFIKGVWGLGAESLNCPTEVLEYKALMIHVIYSSLASSREVFH